MGSGGGGGVGGGGSGGGVNGSGGGVDGGGGRPVSASCGLASGVGRRSWIFIDTLNILATFGYYLASFLASVYLLVSQKETNKTNTQIKNGYFVMCIRVSVQRNHLFAKQIHKRWLGR